ncbi:hypothetical protein [Paenibacillus wynnii]|uniref:hypothetical protein n=1 Tax=Paenibacillus wynnii TaxID=268407 RepID=UPI00279124B2|nr:hypothetical protein [Paenibacillus wynnii]MDQ0193379.1 hypothetical protein [Paenibacillus wynnii]
MGEELKMELAFKVKDIFNPDDKLARWVLKLAIARNDMLHVHKQLLEAFDANSDNNIGESVYLFRIAVSHLREIIKLTTFGYENQNINSFIRKMDLETQKHYEMLIFTKNDLFLNEVLIPIRNNLFHYYDKDKDKEFNEKLNQMDDIEGKIKITGNFIKDVDYVFADEVSFNISLGNISYEDFVVRVKEISSYMVSFISAADTITGKYLDTKREHIRII